jgi:hypothetical protein
MPRNITIQIGLRRIAALFALTVLLTGTAAAPLPQEETPPADLPTPAMLRAERMELLDRPIEPSANIRAETPSDQESQPAEGPNLSVTHTCTNDPYVKPEDLRYAWNKYTFSTYIPEQGGWQIRMGDPCTSHYSHTVLYRASGPPYYTRLAYDAGKVVFVHDLNGNQEIYTIGTIGGTEKRLTNLASIETMPAWSPDGTKIAFVSDRSGDGELYTMNPDGSGARRLTYHKMLALHPDWSPDGTQIAYTLSNGREGQIVIMNASGGGMRAVTPVLPLLGRARFSADGKRLVYEYDADGNGWIDLGLVNPDGTGRRRLLTAYNPNSDVELGNWSGDGSLIFYTEIVYIYDRGMGSWFIQTSVDMMFDMTDLKNEWPLYGGVGNGALGVAMFLDVRTPDLRSPESWLEKSSGQWVREDKEQLILQYNAVDPGIAGLHNVRVKVLNISGQGHNCETSMHEPTLYMLPNGERRSPQHRGTYSWTPYGSGKYSLYIQAHDFAGNVEPYHPLADGYINVYSTRSDLLVQDARENAIGRAAVQVIPATMNAPVTSATGQATAYFCTDNYPFQLAINRTGFAKVPDRTHDARNGDTSFSVTLPGMDEQVSNGEFSGTPALQGWQVSEGATAATVVRWTGNDAADLRTPAVQGPVTATLSQTITLPATMYKPTLSFFFGLTRTDPTQQVALNAIILEEGQPPAQVASSSVVDLNWAHAWADLTPWIGKTVTLQFQLAQSQGDFAAHMMLDEISVTSWTSPVLRSIAPEQIVTPSPEGDWITITGDNLMAESSVFIGNLQLGTVEFDPETGTLRALLDQALPIGRHDLRVVAPSGVEERLTDVLTIGLEQWVPLVRK